VRDEPVQLDKGVLVQEEFEPFSCRELATLVLGANARLSPTQLGLRLRASRRSRDSRIVMGDGNGVC